MHFAVEKIIQSRKELFNSFNGVNQQKNSITHQQLVHTAIIRTFTISSKCRQDKYVSLWVKNTLTPFRVVKIRNTTI